MPRSREAMVYSSLSDIMLPFAVEPLSVALGFMLVGELIKKKQNIIIKWLDNHWLVLFLLIHQASFLSRNSMGFICMNQFFILLFELLFQQLMFDGTFVLMIDKMAIFVLVMIVISLLTHVIMHSKCRIFLGAR